MGSLCPTVMRLRDPSSAYEDVPTCFRPRHPRKTKNVTLGGQGPVGRVVSGTCLHGFEEPQVLHTEGERYKEGRTGVNSRKPQEPGTDPAFQPHTSLFSITFFILAS
jgi:hypothetical protein